MTKWGNYGMFHTWSLDRPCVMEMFLVFFVQGSIGIVGYRDSSCCCPVLQYIILILKGRGRKSNQHHTLLKWPDS